MYFRGLAVSSLILTASTLTAAEPAPYKIGAISHNQLFGVVKRQQGTSTYGYQPTQTPCGSGDTCAIACGAGSQPCASNDGQSHCYFPNEGDICCPDLSGNSCSSGYYCTTDSTGGTWCCPNGMSLTNCAAAYSITGSLVSETSTAAPTTAPSSSPSSTTVANSPSTSAPSASTSSTSTTLFAASTSSSTSNVVTSSTSSSSSLVATTTSGGSVVTFSATQSATVTFKGAASELVPFRSLPIVTLVLGFVGIVVVL